MSSLRWDKKIAFVILAFATLIVVTKPLDASEYRISTIDTDRARLLTTKAKAAYEAIGQDVSFHFQPSKRSLLEVNSGKYDAELAQIQGVEDLFPNLEMVPEPIFEVSVSAVVRKSSDITSVSWDDLQTLTFATPFIKRLVENRTGGDSGITVQSPRDIVHMVSHERVDVGIMLTIDAIEYAALDNKVIVVSKLVEKRLLYHFVHQKHRELIPALTKALREINKKGLSAGVAF